MELDQSVFHLQHSLHSLSPACSVHGRKLYRFPFLNLALSLLIDLHWSKIYDDLQRNGFAIEARVDNVWSHFSQFGHVLDVYLSKDEGKTCQMALVL
ncbi:hypothetical protein RGQ29_031696 [Quercus rubra]|uniref:RRM domain-containing protein n=1 Tax=Quercus rubra TaxID=3512 RepID=A0AAN7EL12_QUERU|nr:hypothetical protein RGQ29_031696 [Quercus rubra]